MAAYAAYVACVVGLVGVAGLIGYAAGRRKREPENIGQLRQTACQRCIYLNRCLDMYKGDMQRVMADLEPHYCRHCEINKIGG